MNIRLLAAVWVARLLAWLLRLAGRRATSLPGLAAMRVCPGLPGLLLRQLDLLALVTGTNGKTTTTAMLRAMLAETGGEWISNEIGANLMQGVAAALLAHADWRGRLRARRAVLEVDEATLPRLAALRTPTLIVVTNVLRDQLDRYGEIDQALAHLRAGLQNPAAAAVLNADDPLSASLGRERELTYYYGVEALPAAAGAPQGEVRDGAFCLLCGLELVYERVISGQMGAYRCPAGHFARPRPHFAAVLEEGGKVRAADGMAGPDACLEYEFAAPVHGLYNYYNLLAAACAARALGCGPRQIERGAAAYRAPTGRMQVFPGEPRRILTLIKNPAGADAVLRALEREPGPKRICFAINDADADGRDVSWLWDIDLESFVPRSRCREWYCAGLRREDMALRLAYAGVERSAIALVADLDAAAAIGSEGGGAPDVHILSTYTALHALADRLSAAARSAADADARREGGTAS